jgi:hypothetical protein
MLPNILFFFACVGLFTVVITAQSHSAIFFASTVSHTGQSDAINLQMTGSDTCSVTSFGAFDPSSHQNAVWDSRKNVMHGYAQGERGAAPAIRSWASNGSDVGTPVPLVNYSSSPLALLLDTTDEQPGSLLAFSIQPSILSRIDIHTGVAHMLLGISQSTYSWIVPSSAFDASTALVYQVAYTVNATGSMALFLLAMRTRAPFSYTFVPLTAADASIAALMSATGLWGLAVAQAGKSLAAVLQLSLAESNMLVSIDATTGTVTRLGSQRDEFAGASVMGGIVSVGGQLVVDTLDSSETTNRLYAFDAVTGTMLAAAVCPRIYNILDFVAFQR